MKVLYTRDKIEKEYKINVKEKLKVLKNIGLMREIIKNEDMPPPTKDSGKCVDCEFWKVCRRA
ncbi:MAG: Dna2/Cas4 domain-containing protein [Candidatus Helarchaeota archaeon]